MVLATAAAVLLVVLAGGYFAAKKFFAPPPPPPPVVTRPKPAAKPAAPAPLPSVTELAHTSVDAVKEAKTAVEAVTPGGAVADKPAAPAAPKFVETESKIAPGVSATNSNVEAVAEATPAFRSFVANAKIVGVIEADPAKMILNGRLARAGETVDAGLGVIFSGLDIEKRIILFKDKTGATVTRRY